MTWVFGLFGPVRALLSAPLLFPDRLPDTYSLQLTPAWVVLAWFFHWGVAEFRPTRQGWLLACPGLCVTFLIATVLLSVRPGR
jgi:hypothetical protein